MTIELNAMRANPLLRSVSALFPVLKGLVFSRQRFFLLSCLLFAGISFFLSTPGFAAERKGRRVIQIKEAARVIGEIQRPQVTYILNRSRRVQMSLDPSLERIRPSFLGTFQKVVEDHPSIFLPGSEP